jgi:tRNA (mo5U34)-methyltransferase
MAFTKEQKQEMINSVPFWWHSIDLGDGVVTPGHNHQFAERAIARRIPHQLHGKTVLDIGCWDGKHAFEAESRQAAEVLAIDSGQQVEFVKSKYNQEIDPLQGIEVAKTILASNVNIERIDFTELRSEQFDVTLFLGVLYHQENPIEALRILYELTGETTIIESAVLLDPRSRPRHKYYPEAELNNDPTNWYVPNKPRLMEWIQDAGFSKVKFLGKYALGTRALVQAWR